MTHAPLDIPVFDADNHLYETIDSLTKFLPDQYRGAVDYVDVRGRKKIVVRGRISEYIPNPTFEVVARPGAMEDYFRIGNPEGKNRREIFGEPMRSIPPRASCRSSVMSNKRYLKLVEPRLATRIFMVESVQGCASQHLRPS